MASFLLFRPQADGPSPAELQARFLANALPALLEQEDDRACLWFEQTSDVVHLALACGRVVTAELAPDYSRKSGLYGRIMDQLYGCGFDYVDPDE